MIFSEILPDGRVSVVQGIAPCLIWYNYTKAKLERFFGRGLISVFSFHALWKNNRLGWPVATRWGSPPPKPRMLSGNSLN